VRADLGKALVCLPLPCICVCMRALCQVPASLNMCGMRDRVLSVQQSDNTGTDVAARASPGIQVGLGLNKREVAASVYDFQPSFCACTICTAGRRSPSDADTSRSDKSLRPSLHLWCAVFRHAQRPQYKSMTRLNLSDGTAPALKRPHTRRA
jgi:hypothetical protein